MQTACPRCQSPLPDRLDPPRCPQCGHSFSGRPRALSGFSGLVARSPSQRPPPNTQPVAPSTPPRREVERDVWEFSDEPPPAPAPPPPSPPPAAAPSIFRAPTNPAPRGLGVPSSPVQRPRVATAASVRSTVTLPLADLSVKGDRITLSPGEVGHTTLAMMAPDVSPSSAPRSMGLPGTRSEPRPPNEPEPPTDSLRETRGFDVVTLAAAQVVAPTAAPTPAPVVEPPAPIRPSPPAPQPPTAPPTTSEDQVRRTVQVALALALIVSPAVHGLRDREHWARLSLPGVLVCLVVALPLSEALRATLVTMVALPTLARELFYTGAPAWWSGFSELATMATLPSGALGVLRRNGDPLVRGLTLLGAACAAAWIARAADGWTVLLLLTAAVMGVITAWRGEVKTAWLTLALTGAWVATVSWRGGAGVGQSIAMVALGALVATGVAGSAKALSRGG